MHGLINSLVSDILDHYEKYREGLLTGKAIQQAISELTRGKTIITIAHRLATIRNADQILVVDDGRIAERGTHAELVQQDGLYKRFTSIREQAEGWRIAAE